MNEKAVFFFPATKKKIQLLDRLNEWHVNFYRKKKTQKKHTKIWKKKTHPTFKEKKEKPTTSWMNASWTFSGKKKIHPCIFFFRFAEKKKHKILGFDWLIDPPTFSGKKKNTIPLITGTFFYGDFLENCHDHFENVSVRCHRYFFISPHW